MTADQNFHRLDLLLKELVEHEDEDEDEDDNQDLLYIFNVIKATLDYPASVQVKAEKLATDIIFCSAEADNDDIGPGTQCEVMKLVLDMITYIAPGHEWQESLILAFASLRKRKDPVPYYPTASWDDLPGFGLYSLEKWNSLLTGGDRWRSWNSFQARITTALNWDTWRMLFACSIRDTLETVILPTSDEYEWDNALWVVTEWFLHADLRYLFEVMVSGMEQTDTSYKLGPAAEAAGVSSVYSLKRWQFWRSRFVQFAADAEKMGLSDDIVKRLNDAVERMDAVEAEGNGAGKKKTAATAVKKSSDRASSTTEKVAHPGDENSSMGGIWRKLRSKLHSQ